MLDQPEVIDSTTLAPVVPSSAGLWGPFSTTKYAATLARREIQRRPWRALMVVMLVAVPTWAMTALMMIDRTLAAESAHEGDFAADLVISVGQSAIDDPAPIGSDQASRTGIADVEARLPVGSTVQRFFHTVTAIMDANGEIHGAELTDIDLGAPAAAPRWPLFDGVAPRPGEIALDEWLARDLGVGVGDTLVLQHPSGEWRVAATTGNGDDLLVIPGFDDTKIVRPGWTFLVDLPAATTQRQADAIVAELDGWYPDGSRFSQWGSLPVERGAGVGLSLLAAVLVFTVFGVVIVAAFATISRGQLVLVGQLSSNGARQRFIQRMLALQGFWGGVVGVVVGTVAVIPFRGFLRGWIETTELSRPIAGLSWHPFDTLAIAMIGIAFATGAAMIPARMLARSSVLGALAGVRPQRPVPRWMVPAGVALFGFGLLMLGASTTTSFDAASVAALFGTLSMAIAICLVGPFVIALVARAAPHLPLVMRMSLRGIDRARLRSAAVVSSVAIATGAMAVFIAAVEADHRVAPGQIATNIVAVGGEAAVEIRGADGQPLFDDNLTWLGDPTDRVDAVDLRWVSVPNRDATERVRRLLPGVIATRFDIASLSDGTYDNADGHFVADVESMGDGLDHLDAPFELGPVLYQLTSEAPLIADDAVLRALSLPETFDDKLDVAGYAWAISSDGRPECSGWLSDDGPVAMWDGKPVASVASVASDAPAAGLLAIEPALIPVSGINCYDSAGPFMTAKFAADHGFAVRPGGTLFANPNPLTDAERSELYSEDGEAITSAFVDWSYPPVDRDVEDGAASNASPDGSFAIQSYPGEIGGLTLNIPVFSDAEYSRYQSISVGLALTLVAIITGIGLTLAASDSRRERATLRIVGARPSVQRRILATDAWLLATIGSLLGVPAALFAARVVTSTIDRSGPTGVPWLYVAAECVAVPLFVGLIAYLAGFRQHRPPDDRLVLAD